MDHTLEDEALILSYQLHRNDSLENLCFCESCKRIRTAISSLQLNEMRRAFDQAC